MLHVEHEQVYQAIIDARLREKVRFDRDGFSRAAGGIASRGLALPVTSESFAADVKSETMAITDPRNPGNIGKIGTSS